MLVKLYRLKSIKSGKIGLIVYTDKGAKAAIDKYDKKGVKVEAILYKENVKIKDQFENGIVTFFIDTTTEAAGRF